MMASNQAAVPPRLARVLYRSLLRASQNGRHPEVFGRHGAAVFNAQVTANKEHPSLALPDKPAHVRRRLKAWFQNPTHGESSGMEALRHAMEQQEMLPLHCRDSWSCSRMTSQESILPIFDYDGIAALPGETIQFVFLEPRYLHLASQVKKSSSKHFLLRASPNSQSATLLKLVSHIRLPGDMVAVACQGGPRIKVMKESVEHVQGEMDPDVAEQYNVDLERSTKLSQAIDYEWQADDAHTEVTRDAAWMTQTRQYILDMLNYLLPLQDSELTETLTTFGLPPIDPEAFSFWALRYVVAIDDVQTRLEWTHNCSSTVKRLEFVVSEVEAIFEQHEEEKTAAVRYA